MAGGKKDGKLVNPNSCCLSTAAIAGERRDQKLAAIITPPVKPRAASRSFLLADLKKTELLVLAIAIHNIPEGLAVGVAFGAIASGMDIGFTLGGAIALAIGMGLQNAPEGFAVSMPMRRAGFSRFKSWQWGQLSAIVEPIFAVIGAAIVILVYPILPYALAFAAGAMIFIVVEEVIPESQSGGNADIATMGLIAGFIVMMCLDVALG